MKRIIIIPLFLLGLMRLGYSQTAIPNSFLDLKLRMSLSDFMANNSADAVESSFHFFITEISAEGMTVYRVEKTTSSGEKVRIDCCFYNDMLAVIGVEYLGLVLSKDLISALKLKYGPYSSYDVKEWTNLMVGQSRTTETIYWKKKTCILNYLYTHELTLAQLVFADKTIQDELKAAEQKKNSKLLE